MNSFAVEIIVQLKRPDGLGDGFAEVRVLSSVIRYHDVAIFVWAGSENDGLAKESFAWFETATEG